jgi:HYR domain
VGLDAIVGRLSGRTPSAVMPTRGETRRARARIRLAILLALALALVAPVPGARADGSCSTVESTIVCTYTGTDTFTVPSGVSEVTVTAIGDRGSNGVTGRNDSKPFACGGTSDGGTGGTGGQGAKVTGTITGLAAGDTLDVRVAPELQGSTTRVGGAWGIGWRALGNTEGCGTLEGSEGGHGGGGGDASFVTKNGAVAVVAAGGGGGGGGGACTCSPGGDGGDAGEDGEDVALALGGSAGTTSSGTGEDGGDATDFAQLADLAVGGGGGGGGGLKGGGGGEGGAFDGGGGGGGGSSLVPSGGSVTTTSSAPTVTISHPLPDNDPPVTAIDLSPSSPNGSNGWYTSSVTVTVSASDTGGSGVDEIRCELDPASTAYLFTDLPSTPCPYLGDGAAVSEEGTHAIYAASKDNVGNEGLVAGTNFKIDKTAPTITAAAATSPNGSGWYNGDVVVHFTCSDARSGIPAGACPSDQVLSTDGLAVASTAKTVTDAAGNTSAPSNVVTVDIDHTPPTITGGATTQPNQAGWYRDDVEVSFVCHDDLSGVATPPGCPAAFTVTSEGTHNIGARTTKDVAGNESAPTEPFTIRIDKTPPVVSVPAPITVNATGPAGATVSYAAGASDNLDPSPAIACAPASGGVFSIGTTTVTCKATDDAGNPSATKQFTVKVLSAAEQLGALRTAVTGVGAGTSLADKVTEIQKAVADGRTRSACSGLSEFLTMVATQAKANKLTSAQAASFTAQANRLRAVLSC